MRYEETECPVDNVGLIRYLQSWGLREFRDEDSYYEWQRSILSKEELQSLNRLIEHRHGGEHESSDIEFYDGLARPDIVPVLYSQRFNYFLTIGSAVCSRIPPAERVLDFGCGVGILTVFFAQQYPHIEFVGLDRSSRSIALAKFEAETRRLTNIRFEVSHVPPYSNIEAYDLILSTQALFQAEREPGLPSRDWRTFQRLNDTQRQEQLEIRTGLQGRLNNLVSVLQPTGRMIIFEKTWNLGRRIFFQRALEARGLHLISSPIPCRYRSLDENVIDGPMFEVARLTKRKLIAWNEEPYRVLGETLYRCKGISASRMARELELDGMVESVSGIHSVLGSWTLRLGVWNQALVWAFFENSSGLKGLVMGGKVDKDLLLSLAETFKHINESDFQELVRDFWGHIDQVNDELSVPCYENHHASAQFIYEALPFKIIQQESTFQDGEGREMHIELGITINFTYLYWANNFDQRQLVIMDEERAHVLKAYYRESLIHPQGPPA